MQPVVQRHTQASRLDHPAKWPPVKIVPIEM